MLRSQGIGWREIAGELGFGVGTLSIESLQGVPKLGKRFLEGGKQLFLGFWEGRPAATADLGSDKS